MITLADVDAAFDHEAVVVERDPALGLTAVVAVHSTVLGPAEGGLRIKPYESLMAAVLDALRLSAAMTLKTSAAGLPLGGGKAVMLPPPPGSDRQAVMHAMGDMVDRLGGRFVVAEDVGTAPQDMDWIGDRTGWVAGLSPAKGGFGDPSPSTAVTVLGAIREAVAVVDGRTDLTGVSVGVLGVGKVGGALAELATRAGADVVVADVDEGRAQAVADTTGASLVPVAGFLDRPFDVFAPCAGGQVLSTEAAAALRARVVAGAANNQLTDDSAAAVLHDRGVLYVPDFIANCGGVIFNAAEYLKRDRNSIEADLEEAIRRTGKILRTAAAAGVSPLQVARRVALDRINAARDDVASGAVA